MQNLVGAKTSQLEIRNFVGFEITITDHASWVNNVDQLIPLFGKVIFEEYEKEKFDLNNNAQQPRVLHQLEVSFRDIDYMYVLFDQDTLVGLIAMKVLLKEPKIGIVVELILSPEYRGKGISPKLYDLVFNSQDFYAITSYSRYPAAVAARYSVGSKYGYETVFGDMPTNSQEISDLQNLAKEYFTKDGIVAGIAAPKGYIFLKGEENINSPLQAGEAKFSVDHPLYKPFQRILEIQKTNSKDTAVGLLVSVKRP